MLGHCPRAGTDKREHPVVGLHNVRLNLSVKVLDFVQCGGDSRTGNILREMINTLEQRKWSCLQEDRRPIMPGVSGQAFRCWRVWYGGVSLARPGFWRYLLPRTTG